MVLLRARNPVIGNLERTEIKTAISAGATSVDVDDTEGFSANDFVVIGELGQDTTEAVRITAITDSDTLAVTATNFAHAIDEPIQKTLFNQIKFYSDADSYATALNTSDVDWANPDQRTHYNDTSGTSSTKYKFTFYNSQSGTEGDLSPEYAIPVYYCSIQDVEDYLNINVSQDGEIRPHQVAAMIRSATKDADTLTNGSFKSNTATLEYHSGNKCSNPHYFTDNRPIISVTTFQITQSSPDVGPDNATWTSLTEDDDFTVDSETGRLTILADNLLPNKGDSRVRLTYDWGYSTVPDDINELTVLLVARKLIQSGVGKGILQTQENNSINLGVLDGEIARIVSKYNRADMLNT